MKKIIIFLYILLLFSTSIVFAEDKNIDMWKYQKEILIKDEFEYKAIMLDKEVYKHSNYDLSDIRIVDQNDEFVPYYIESQYEEIGQQNSLFPYNAEKILTFSKNDDLYIDFKLINESTEKDFIVNQIDLIFDLKFNFAKDVVIYGSYDNEKWDLIKKDNIFNISEENKSKTSVYFEENYKYSYYRIVILKNIENIQAQGMVAINNQGTIINKNDYIVEEKLEYKINQESNNTLITVSNPDKLKIFKIQVFTKDLFNREYTLQSQNNQLYSTGSINSDSGGNIINIYDNYNRKEVERLDLTIDNKDDSPININGVRVSYYIDKLIFKANKDDEYRMLVGNENATAPSYDITSYKALIESEEKELVVFGDTIENVIEQPILKKNNMKLISNIAVIITSLFLIFIIFKSIRKKQ